MNGKRFTVIAMALAMVLSVFAGPAALMTASASDHTGISAKPDNAGETSGIHIIEDVPADADGEALASVTINADSTDFSNVATGDITIGIDTNADGTIDTTQMSHVSSVSTSDSGTTLTVTMDDANTATLSESDDIIVSVANSNLPADEGDYSVSADVNTYDAGSFTLDITPPLSTLDVTVEDRRGDAVSFADVTVEGKTVAAGENGTASMDVTAWEQTVVVSADGYDDATREITVSEDGDSATIVVTEPGAVFASGNVEGVQIAAEQSDGLLPFSVFGADSVTSVDVTETATDGNVVVDLGPSVAEDITAEAADGEGVTAFTATVDGETVPVYAGSADAAEDGETYGVYDAENNEIEFTLGDSYNAGEEVDVGVSSASMNPVEEVQTYWMSGLGFDGLGLDGLFGGGDSSDGGDTAAVIAAPSF